MADSNKLNELNKLNKLGDLEVRRRKMRGAMARVGADAMLLTCAANMIYAAGRALNGYYYLPAEPDGSLLSADSILFLRKPVGIQSDSVGVKVEYIRKPEQIPALLAQIGLPLPKRLLIEDDEISYAEGRRLATIFPETELLPGSTLMRRVRSVKTPYEIEMHRISCARVAEVFARIPEFYRPGMTDDELSRQIEQELRRRGHLAMVRSFGRSLETPASGSLLAGDNAVTPSPYDFAVGGAGMDPTIPVGANGTVLSEGQCLLVDFGANFTGYLADISRTYAIGKPSEQAVAAHGVALAVQEMMIREARPSAVCGDLYDMALRYVAQSGFAKYFMGYSQQSKFFGHGVGLELNELPVIALRADTKLEAGMVIAVEPKFTLPGIGAVGTENTFLVTETGLEKLTDIGDEIIPLA